MGKTRTESQKKANTRGREVCFPQRRQGLFKKAKELSILCGVDVAVLVFSPAGDFFSFANRDIVSILGRYGKQTPLCSEKVNVEKMEEEEEEEEEQLQQVRGNVDTPLALVPSSSPDMTMCAVPFLDPLPPYPMGDDDESVKPPLPPAPLVLDFDKDDGDQLITSNFTQDDGQVKPILNEDEDDHVMSLISELNSEANFDSIFSDGLFKAILKEDGDGDGDADGDGDEDDERVMSLISELSREANFDYIFPHCF